MLINNMAINMAITHHGFQYSIGDASWRLAGCTQTSAHMTFNTPLEMLVGGTVYNGSYVGFFQYSIGNAKKEAIIAILRGYA